MSEAAAGATERPLCPCHGRPMQRHPKSKGGWECAARANYRRGRNRLRERIAAKRARLDRLESDA